MVIGVADCKWGQGENIVLTTYALGSCLGITFYDHHKKCGALLHAMLPQAKDGVRSPGREWMFLDTGVPLVLKQLKDKGVTETNLECKVFGGAQVLEADKFFCIGAKNINLFKEISSKYRLKVSVWETGGQVNRTIRLYLESGKVKLKTPSKGEEWL